MRASTIALALCAVALTSHSVAAVDEDACKWQLSPMGCVPAAFCSYQYKFGDLTPSQSCRPKKGANKLPQQVHLAFAGESTGTGMTVSWATFDNVEDSGIWVGTSEKELQEVDVAVSSASYYSEGSYALFQHHATVTGLTPNTKYFYQVGSKGDDKLRTGVGSFKTAQASTDATFNAAIYGDLGDGKHSDATISYLNTLGDKIDFVYHIGDISYADDDFLDPKQALGFFYEEVYNKWMNLLTPLMSKVPYMVTVGNHEAECHSPACLVSKYKKDRLGNYAAYNARFKMPSKETKGVQNMWYSFDHGPVHFTSISSETDYLGAPSNAYTGTHKNGNFGNQLAWLEEDLKKAHANRENVPWIIVGMHRPIYYIENANKDGEPTGDVKALQKAFEPLFLKYGVDVVFAGHQHSYERQMPIAKSQTIRSGVSSDMKTYDTPRAPVYVVSGGAGNPEPNRAPISFSNKPWHIMSTAKYGISTLEASKDSLQFKYVASSNQEVIDEFTIVKS